jgi:hypothetical protein
MEALPGLGGGLTGGLLQRDFIPDAGNGLGRQGLRNQGLVIPSFEKGGKVTHTGLYKLHKGETVVPAASGGANVRKARMNMRRKQKKAMVGKTTAPGGSAPRQMMGQHDTPQGMGASGTKMPMSRRKAARRKAFLGY